jgi:uncharacterized RDD family membrane protein YckC
MTQAFIASAASFRRDALSGVRTRRMLAICLDIILIALLTAAFWILAGLLTLGFAWFFLPPLFPLIAFLYNGLSVSSANMGTPGMRAFDVEMRMHESGARVPFINAAAQALFFYVSWFFPPVFLVSLVDSEKRFLHDILSGVVLTRRL